MSTDTKRIVVTGDSRLPAHNRVVEIQASAFGFRVTVDGALYDHCDDVPDPDDPKTSLWRFAPMGR